MWQLKFWTDHGACRSSYKDKIMRTEAIAQIQHISYTLYACMYCKKFTKNSYIY